MFTNVSGVNMPLAIFLVMALAYLLLVCFVSVLNNMGIVYMF